MPRLRASERVDHPVALIGLRGFEIHVVQRAPVEERHVGRRRPRHVERVHLQPLPLAAAGVRDIPVQGGIDSARQAAETLGIAPSCIGHQHFTREVVRKHPAALLSTNAASAATRTRVAFVRPTDR